MSNKSMPYYKSDCMPLIYKLKNISKLINCRSDRSYIRNSSVLLLLFILSIIGLETKAQYAAGGNAYYKNQIFWMSWDATRLAEFNKSGGVMHWTEANGLPKGVEINMTVTALSGEGRIYTSGTGSYDTFRDLFGGISNNAIATAENATLTRSINLSVTLNGTAITPRLVFSDAENSTAGEYIKVTRQGLEGWFLLEGWDRTTVNNSDYTFTISGTNRQVATTQPLGSDLNSPYGTYVLMAPNASSFDLEMKGAATTAVALGLMLPNDYSDALNYSPANHLIQPTITSLRLSSGTFGENEDNDGVINPNSNPLFYWPIATMKNDLYLGFSIDADNSFSANKEATGDDLKGGDDEDGVSVLPDITINSINDYLLTCYSSNNTGKNASLYAWIDLNRNGQFENIEMINSGNPVSLSSIGININTLMWKLSDFSCDAGTIKAGPSYLRIRITTKDLSAVEPGFDGRSIETAIDGEVEDYLINILGYDYGDLPSSFNSAKALINTDSNNDGIPDAAGSIWLGSLVDYNECASQSTAEANGDDTNGVSDEDGLTIPEDLIAGRSSDWLLSLNSQASVANVQWGIWLDWNGNGTFSDIGDGFYSGQTDVAALTQTAVSILAPTGSSPKFGVRVMVRPETQGAFVKNDDSADLINGEIEDYIVEFPLKAYIIDQKNVPCFGGNNGEVTVEATGGTPPYQFSIDEINYTSTVNYTNLSAGIYTIYVKDNAGASVTVPVTITQTLEAVKAVISAQTDISCFGETNGSATVVASGGTPPYRFYFNGEATPGTTGIYTNLAAGNYPLVILDANDCQANLMINITQPDAALSATASVTNLDCNGSDNGSFTVAATGGISPYSYSIDGGATYQTSSIFSNLAANAYSVKVKDTNECTFDLPVTITQPEVLNASVSAKTEVSCFGSNTGSVTVSTTGGTAPYRYSTDNGVTENNTGVFDNLPAGDYTVLVKDANNCQTTVTFTISQPVSALQATVSSKSDIDCFGENDGSASIIIEGGTAPYQIYFNGETLPRASGDFTGLVAGSYPVRVVDSKNCEVSITITITSPEAALTATFSTTNIDCYGSANGSFTVTANGGTTPYSYSIDGGATYQISPTFSNLAPNSYAVNVKDANNCTTDLNVTITQPEELKASATTITEVNCFGTGTGSATIIASGGTSPYRYSIDNGATENTTGEFTGLMAGNYNVLVKDQNNCQTTISLTISQPEAALQATVTTQSNINCFGADDASATVTATGGTAPYNYYFNGETLPRASGDFSGLTAGTYPVRVVDSKNCEVSITITITSPEAALTASVSEKTDPNCYGNTGSFAVSATGGTSPYSYSIDGGTVYQTESTFSNLAANTYTVKVKDSKNCTTEVSVTLIQPEALTASVITKTDAICFESSTGTATVNAAGGTSPYQYSIDNGQSFNTTGAFTNLIAGDYTVLVKDLNNCQTTLSFTITQPETSLQATVTSQTNVDCINQTGAFTIVASGGVEPYTYSLNGGTSLSSGTFSGLAIGQYEVSVLDSKGCSIDQTISILDLTGMEPSLTSDVQTICKNTPVTFTAAGGDEYEFFINGTVARPRSANTIFSTSTLSDGDAVTVEVYNTTTGCQASAGPIIITVNPIPTVTITDFTDICTVVPPFALTGGLPEGGIYSGTGVANGIFNPAGAGVGTHTIVYTYTDVKGCSNSASTTIKVEDCNLALTQNTLFNDENNDGHAQVGETISFQYIIKNSGAVALTNLIVTDPLLTINGNEIVTLGAGSIDNSTFTATYILKQADIDNGKFASQATVTGIAYGNITITDLSDDPLNMTDDDPDNDGDSDDQTITLLNVVPIAVDDLVIIDEDNEITVPVINNDSFGGNGPSNHPVNVLALPLHGIIESNNGGTPNNPTDDRLIYIPNPEYNGTDSFVYEICDSDGDCASATVSITVNAVNDAPDSADDEYSTIEYHPLEGNVLDNDSDKDNLQSELTVNTNPVSRPAHGTLQLMSDGNFIYTPRMDFVGLDYFEYEVCDNGTPNRCSTAKVVIEINPDEECQVLVPNGFSPDGDGIGDYFKIRCLYRFPEAHLQVYNRWGSLVYDKKHYGNQDVWTGNDEWWDGRSNNKWAISNDVLPSGTYVYILKLDDGQIKKGTVFIKR